MPGLAQPTNHVSPIEYTPPPRCNTWSSYVCSPDVYALIDVEVPGHRLIYLVYTHTHGVHTVLSKLYIVQPPLLSPTYVFVFSSSGGSVQTNLNLEAHHTSTYNIHTWYQYNILCRTGPPSNAKIQYHTHRRPSRVCMPRFLRHSFGLVWFGLFGLVCFSRPRRAS